MDVVFTAIIAYVIDGLGTRLGVERGLWYIAVCNHFHFLILASSISCSVCMKKQNRHFIIPEMDFKLLQVKL